MKETQISTKRIYEGKVINVRVDQAEVNHCQVVREMVEHPGGVAVLAMDENQEIFCVTQYRYAQGKEMLELPAGKLERGEDPLETGKRELIEETGYKAENWLFLGEFVPTGAYLEEKIYMYFASELSYVGQHFDEDEYIELSKHTLEELIEMILEQRIVDGKTIAMVLKVDKMIERGLLK